MWSKIIFFVLELLLGQPAPPAGTMAGTSMQATRKIALLLAVTGAALFVFFSGLFTVLLDLTLTSRDQGGLALSAVSGVGFGLIVVALGAGAVSLRKAAWLPVRVEPASASPSPLNQALADLVRDFIQERRVARAFDGASVGEEPSGEPRSRYEDRGTEPPPVYM